ncbi:MAG: RDD family protein [Thermoleophilia bacterium]
MTATQQPDPFGGEAQSSSGPSGPRAGFWLRFAGALIDGILLSIVTVPLQLSVDPAMYYAVALPIGIAYYVLLEGGARGQTVGKMAVGIRVYDLAGGGPIGYGRAFIRYIGRYVSAIVLLLGYFWMLWDKEKQTWHDKFAGSVVVPTSAYPVG